MNWLWAYFRRKATESILAGVHDALVTGSGPTGLTEEQAAKALQAVVGISAAVAPTPPAIAGPATPQLTASSANSPTPPAEEPRRGPGRPRKFQEPPPG